MIWQTFDHRDGRIGTVRNCPQPRLLSASFISVIRPAAT
jgi:hypothetical protein